MGTYKTKLDLHRKKKQHYLTILDKPILSFSGEYLLARELLDEYVYRLLGNKEDAIPR